MANAKKKIRAAHDEIYGYLIGLHNSDDEFRFRIRPKDDIYFTEGCWFDGEEKNFIRISFWGLDSQNDTFAIRLYLPFEGNPICELDANGSDGNKAQKLTFFEGIARELSLSKSTYKPNNWYKYLEKETAPLEVVKVFVQNQKKIIDTYIRENTYKVDNTFITKASFESYLNRVERVKKFKEEEARLCLISKPTLPNALSRISISNFQGIKELIIENLPLSANWIFLTGENSFGKTSILRAIAKGFVGDESYVSPMPEDSFILLNALVNGASFKRSTPEKKANMTVPLVAYGVSRFSLTTGDQAASERNKQKTYSLFHDDGQLYNIEQVLINYNAYDKNRFKMLKKVFLKLIPNLKDITIKATNGNPKVIYSEKDEMGNAYEPISLNDLAAGYRSIFTMVGDMIIRLSEGYNNDRLEDLSGIVLIDEIDAHLHPKYQYELPKLLSDIFPKIQFIVTTHSPIPILGLPKENHPVILTVERNAENGISIDRKDDDFDFRQLSTEALLTSPVFGFQTLFARGTTADEIIPTSDFKEVLEIEAIKERLKKLRAEGLVQ